MLCDDVASEFLFFFYISALFYISFSLPFSVFVLLQVHIVDVIQFILQKLENPKLYSVLCSVRIRVCVWVYDTPTSQRVKRREDGDYKRVVGCLWVLVWFGHRFEWKLSTDSFNLAIYGKWTTIPTNRVESWLYRPRIYRQRNFFFLPNHVPPIFYFHYEHAY